MTHVIQSNSSRPSNQLSQFMASQLQLALQNAANAFVEKRNTARMALQCVWEEQWLCRCISHTCNITCQYGWSSAGLVEKETFSGEVFHQHCQQAIIVMYLSYCTIDTTINPCVFTLNEEYETKVTSSTTNYETCCVLQTKSKWSCQRLSVISSHFADIVLCSLAVMKPFTTLPYIPGSVTKPPFNASASACSTLQSLESSDS